MRVFLFQGRAENCAGVDHFPVGCSIHCQFFSPKRSKTVNVTYERFETGTRTEATTANEEEEKGTASGAKEKFKSSFC